MRRGHLTRRATLGASTVIKFFWKLSPLGKVEFLIGKPILLGVYMYMLYQTEFVDSSAPAQFWLLIASLVGFSVIYWVELKMASITYSYKSSRDQDIEKTIEIAARYLQRDFSSVEIYRKSIRGEVTHGGFTQRFYLRASGNRVLVSLSGDFPFPISMIQWLINHSKIENELNSHAYFRT